ncbi:hypothetical protein ZHAS_00015868 [Anopheles sinensis]|uniref:Uncharacterized protein n=1 Tax=Anopheles sinensis TaxID=74873 RepID=A0A084WC50_ANOSI|nr:hypothetical protein ZHAS_00015868 [Anopheles sinensis]
MYLLSALQVEREIEPKDQQWRNSSIGGRKGSIKIAHLNDAKHNGSILLTAPAPCAVKDDPLEVAGDGILRSFGKLMIE